VASFDGYSLAKGDSARELDEPQEDDNLGCIAVIIIGTILMAAILTQPSLSANPDLGSTAGFRCGDYFHYRVSGLFNGTAINGTFNATIYDVFDGGYSVGYLPLNTSSQELNDRFSKGDALISRPRALKSAMAALTRRSA
jgi:hypothetical protein